MGPPLKSFLEISRRQQRRRVRARLQVDIGNLANTANKIAPNPIHLSCSQLTVNSGPTSIPDDIRHEIDHFFHNIERFDDTNKDLNRFDDEKPTTHIQTEAQPQSSSTDLRAFLAHWAVQHKIAHSVVNDLLTGLRKFGHLELPSDSRTLVNTPNRIDIQTIAGGSIIS